jgi:hypothetical protein
MPSSTRRASFVVVAAFLLAALAGGFVGDYFHTDDGCAFETHCLACQRHIGSLAVVVLDLAALPPLAPVGTAVAPPAIALVPAAVPAEAPRGPPKV